jgi:predicted Co/Zn/Cd cation transporter (cation efflux family)
VLGVASGLVTASQAIIFDGMYSFVDVVPTVVSLLVVKLIARGTTHRFQYGSGISSRWWRCCATRSWRWPACMPDRCRERADRGGQRWSTVAPRRGRASSACIGLAMTWLLSRRAQGAEVADAQDRCAQLAGERIPEPRLLIGFALRHVLGGTRFESWIPYLDAIALLSMALIMLPMPLIGLWRSMSDVLQVAPSELDLRVHAVMDRVIEERQFLEYSSYIAKAGRGRFVEIHILVAPGTAIDIEDGRCACAARFRAPQRGSPTFWLTIDFTADRRCCSRPGRRGSNNSTRLPDGSSARICRPPGPATKSLRNCMPAFLSDSTSCSKAVGLHDDPVPASRSGLRPTGRRLRAATPRALGRAQHQFAGSRVFEQSQNWGPIVPRRRKPKVFDVERHRRLDVVDDVANHEGFQAHLGTPDDERTRGWARRSRVRTIGIRHVFRSDGADAAGAASGGRRRPD